MGAALGCREWGAGVNPTFSEQREPLPQGFPRVGGLKVVLEMIPEHPFLARVGILGMPRASTIRALVLGGIQSWSS